MENTQIVSFADLYAMDYELEDIYAERQKWSDGVLYRKDRPRKSNGLIFLSGCSGEYTDRFGSVFAAPCRSLVCLPYRSLYTVLNVSSGADKPDAFLVEFNIVQNDKKLTFSDSPFLIQEVNQYFVRELSRNIVEEYEMLVRSPAKLKSLIYKYIAYLGKEMQTYNKKRMLIAPAVEFIEKNPTSEIPVEQLANMCHISEGYFRKLFVAYSGKSPVQYMIDRKIVTAKKMLEHSNTSIEKIAELLEFESCSYFCKLFKKKTGVTPTQYRNDN